MAEKQQTTQVAVVGGGPGGYAAAFRAADLGLRVTLIDREANPGGVCLYRGCIPSKALLHVARVISESEEAGDWGVQFKKPRIDTGRLVRWKQQVVERLTGGLGQLSKQRKVNYLRGEAAFQDSGTLKVKPQKGGEQVLKFEHCILATGSRPAKIPALDLKSSRVMDSSSALDVPDVPGSLLVIGGGYIGLELGTVYAALGSKVTVVEMMSSILPGVDADLVGVLQRRLEKVCQAVLVNTKVAEMRKTKSGIKVRLEGKDVQKPDRTFDRVLVSVGRKPNSQIPGLDRTRVKVDEKGFIEVDAQRRTAAPNIYAIGDVAGEPMLAHKATHEGRVAVEAIAGEKSVFEPAAIPAVVFTDPEIAWCGLTENEAKQRGIDVEVTRFPWGASGRALSVGRTDGLTKLLLEPESGRVLGMGVAGVGAGELIAEGVLAVEMAALASDLELSIHPHPTLSESVMEAAELFFGASTHVYRKKKPREEKKKAGS